MIDFNEIKDIVLRKDGLFDVQSKKSSNNHEYFTVKWDRVPRYDHKGRLKDPEIFKNEVIAKNGIEYWNQNYELSFLGSSSTLIRSDVLRNLTYIDKIDILDNMLKIYEYPVKGHNYILTVDGAKDGMDSFAIQVVDITTINFVQVATAKLQVDYLKMPEFIVKYCKEYNNAYLIIENNEGAGQSVADFIRQDWEYENMYFDKVKVHNKTVMKNKAYAGFRTTSKTRDLILDNLRMFIEQGKLTINDKDTIEEFQHFIRIDGKYQADDGYHDDLIMALAITFAPFCNTRNIDDVKGLVDALYANHRAEEENDFTEFVPIGFMDDNGDEEADEFRNNLGMEADYSKYYGDSFSGADVEDVSEFE